MQGQSLHCVASLTQSIHFAVQLLLISFLLIKEPREQAAGNWLNVQIGRSTDV